MIANPEKFHCVIISKYISDTSGIDINITNKTIKSAKYVKLLGISIDNKLDFNLHITELCKKASAQLNALYRLKNILPLKAKSILIQSFVYANFNYCPLIWNFSSAKSLQKIDRIQKRALQFILDNNEDSYETLLNKTGKSQMIVYRLRSLCIEIFKILHGLNPSFMKNIFIFNTENRPVRSQNINNLKVHVTKTQTYGTKCITTLGPNTWNLLPNVARVFKEMIKKWDGTKCYCKDCEDQN